MIKYLTEVDLREERLILDHVFFGPKHESGVRLLGES